MHDVGFLSEAQCFARLSPRRTQCPADSWSSLVGPSSPTGSVLPFVSVLVTQLVLHSKHSWLERKRNASNIPCEGHVRKVMPFNFEMTSLFMNRD